MSFFMKQIYKITSYLISITIMVFITGCVVEPLKPDEARETIHVEVKKKHRMTSFGKGEGFVILSTDPRLKKQPYYQPLIARLRGLLINSGYKAFQDPPDIKIVLFYDEELLGKKPIIENKTVRLVENKGKMTGSSGKSEDIKADVIWDHSTGTAKFYGRVDLNSTIHGTLDKNTMTIEGQVGIREAFEGDLFHIHYDKSRRREYIKFEAKDDALRRVDGLIETVYQDKTYITKKETKDFYKQFVAIEVYPYMSPISNSDARLMRGEVIHEGKYIETSKLIPAFLNVLFQRFPGAEFLETTVKVHLPMNAVSTFVNDLDKE